MAKTIEEWEKQLREEEANRIAKERLEVEKRRARDEAYDRQRQYKLAKKASKRNGGKARSGFWGFLWKLFIFAFIFGMGYLLISKYLLSK